MVNRFYQKKLLEIFLSFNPSSKRGKILKKYNYFHKTGNSFYYHPTKLPSEGKLISFGDNVKIATNVRFITHDIINSVFEYSDSGEKLPFYMGPIEIGDNVMVGADAIIMYGSKIENNSIIAAGSVVVNHVKEGTVVGGNPAKEIGKTKELIERRGKLQGFPEINDGWEKIESFFFGSSSNCLNEKKPNK